jgi:hypothetical protein
MYSVVAFFCEDIREEKSGMSTLVGVLPDNVNVSSLPFAFPKIGIYLRINMPADGDDPKSVIFWLTSPDPPQMQPTPIEPSVIEKARREAKEREAVNGGVITKIVIAPLQIRTAGRINLHVKIDDKEFIGGTLNVQLLNNPS